MGAGPTGGMVSFDLTADSPHLLINAQSMAGKSELLAWLVAQVMEKFPDWCSVAATLQDGR